MTDISPIGRPDFIVLTRILDRLWKADCPLLRTHLQVASNMSYDSLIKYLEWMKQRGLIITTGDNNGHERVALTEKGRDACSTIVVWIKNIIDESSNGQH